MNHQAEIKKTLMKVVIWAVVIIALLATMHILVSNLNILDFLKGLHGG